MLTTLFCRIAIYAEAILYGTLERRIVLVFFVRTTKTNGRLAAPVEGILSLSLAKAPLALFVTNLCKRPFTRGGGGGGVSEDGVLLHALRATCKS